MKDKNGVAIKLGDEILYSDGLFQVAGEYDRRAILWSMDPGMCEELIVVPSQLVIVREPLRGFWRWLKGAWNGRMAPRRKERPADIIPSGVALRPSPGG